MWTDRQIDRPDEATCRFFEIILTRLNWCIWFRALSALSFLKNLCICIAPQCCPMLSDHRSPETLPCWCGICGGKSDTGTGFSKLFPIRKIPSLQHIYLHLRDTIPQRKLVILGNLKPKQCCFGNRGAFYPSVVQQPIWSLDRVMADTIRPTDVAELLWTTDQLVAETATYTTHDKHKRWTSMPSAGFELAVPAVEDRKPSLKPQSYLKNERQRNSTYVY